MKKKQLLMLVILALTFVASSVWQSVVYSETPPNLYLTYSIWFGLEAVALWAVFGIGKMKPHEPEHSLIGYGGVLLFILGALAFNGLSGTVINNVGSYFNPEVSTLFAEAQQVNAWTPSKTMLGNLWPLIFAPIFEELTYRVGVLGGLLAFMRKPQAILLSSLVFALVHINVYPPIVVASTFVMGLLLAITYTMVGIRAAIMLHFLNNSQEFWQPWISDSEYWTIAYVLLMLGALFAFLYQLVRHRKLVLR